MSGTSLDGIDLACCQFNAVGCGVDYTVLAAETVPYSPHWTARLATLEQASALDYALADVQLGHLLGREIKSFVLRHNLSVDAIASHGHTIFHQPERGLTTQIGDLDAIAAETGLPVVGRFRQLDVALGGQGAPLVPIGDRLLYANYEARLNLGGICNISFGDVAFDVAPCNMALNLLAKRLGQPFDDHGSLAREGRVLPQLLTAMDALPYYAQSGPKSLGKEWFVANFEPLLDPSINTADLLRTTTEHIAKQVANILVANGLGSLLITGGGAHNDFLVELIANHAPECNVTVPDALTVDYKEAIVFALMGYLRLRGEANCLSSVTGARCNVSGGNISGQMLKSKTAKNRFFDSINLHKMLEISVLGAFM